MRDSERVDEGSPDTRFMERAIALAGGGLGLAAPNPLVGAVVVAGDEIVGEGWHEGPGTPHAEVVALREAGERCRGATLYTTLEPCSHQGRTPPCGRPGLPGPTWILLESESTGLPGADTSRSGAC